jgi:hypothetical protein
LGLLKKHKRWLNSIKITNVENKRSFERCAGGLRDDWVLYDALTYIPNSNYLLMHKTNHLMILLRPDDISCYTCEYGIENENEVLPCWKNRKLYPCWNIETTKDPCPDFKRKPRWW